MVSLGYPNCLIKKVQLAMLTTPVWAAHSLFIKSVCVLAFSGSYFGAGLGCVWLVGIGPTIQGHGAIGSLSLHDPGRWLNRGICAVRQCGPPMRSCSQEQDHYCNLTRLQNDPTVFSSMRVNEKKI